LDYEYEIAIHGGVTMLNTLRSWNIVLAKLGFSRRKQHMRRGRNYLARRLRMEPLEQRQMLSITVNTFIDERDFNLTDGDISLRDAILEATPGETIDFDPDTMNGKTITLSLALGQISFDRSLTIDASMLPLGITIDGNDPNPQPWNGIRIFNITDPTSGADPPNVTMIGLTLRGADPAFNERGGAIQSKGILTLRDMEIVDNAGYEGGGVYLGVAGTGSTERTVLSVQNSVFQNNSAVQNGGGIAVKFRSSGQDKVEITAESTLSGNEAEGNGVASNLVNNIGRHTSIAITGSTIGGNRAGEHGGGLFIGLGEGRVSGRMDRWSTLPVATPATSGPLIIAAVILAHFRSRARFDSEAHLRRPPVAGRS
jgi:predicted outer membrane repeat protein